jgi:ArsR family transcriptional regulator, arsenate/arsenite/antimonite-responsive transcriptional repressor
VATRSAGAELARQLRALGEETRLSIAALLARRPHYGEELAGFLDLSAATVSHHLKQLREAGLVTATRETRHVLFELDREALTEVGELLRSPGGFADHVGVPPEEALSARVLAEWIDEAGHLRELPLARRARRIVLRWLASHLETGRLYPERELRFSLLEITREPDQVRDELVRHGWLRRAGTVYRRVEEVEEP